MSAAENQNPDPIDKHHALIERPQTTALSTDVLMPTSGLLADDEDTIDLRQYWRIIVKRKWTVASFFLIVVIAVATASLLMTPIFRATTVLQIEREAAKVVEFNDVTPIENAGDRDFYQTQYELLQSNTLAQRVIDQLRLTNLDSLHEKDQNLLDWISATFAGSDDSTGQPVSAADIAAEKTRQVKAFLESLTIEPIRNSRLVKVSFDSPDPQLSAKVANAVADNFINVNLERRFEASSYAQTFLEERIRQVKLKLEETERALVEYARDMQIFNVDKDGVTTSALNLQEFNVALAKAQQERIKAESLYLQMQLHKSGDLPQVLENQLIQQLKANKAKLEAEYQENLKTFKPGFPRMQELSGQIAEVSAQIEKEQDNLRQSIRASYEAAKAQEALLSEKLHSSKQDMVEQQSRSIQYNILKREVDTNRQLYDGLLQRLKEVSVAGGVGTNNVSVVDKAEIPTDRFKPNIKLNLLIAMFIGLFGGVGLAFFFEHLDDTFKQASDVESMLGLPVLGLIPAVKGAGERADLIRTAIEDPRSAIAEAYRSTRTALQFSTADGAPRIIAVTSSSMGEGKSTSAVNLAIQFAQSGHSVLLIDADLRNPSLHKVFGAENSLGLTNYLAGTAQPVAITRNTAISNLFMISTGPLPPNPAELLHSKKMTALLELAANKFDHVIIDSPPILGLADALVIANAVDSTLMVIESGATRRDVVQAAVKRLTTVRVRPLGCLLTKIQHHDRGYGYEYYYAYGGQPDSGKKRQPAT